MEGTAGTVPAVLEHLRHILEAGAVHPAFQCLFQLRTQAARGRQADALDGIQMHDLFAAVYILQDHIHAGDGLLGHEHGIIHAKAFTGLDLDLAILKGILTQDDTVHALTLEVDLQRSQGNLGDVLEGQADCVLSAEFALEQFHTDELHRAARGIIVGPGACDRVKIFLHDTRSLRSFVFLRGILRRVGHFLAQHGLLRLFSGLCALGRFCGLHRGRRCGGFLCRLVTVTRG